MIGIIIPPWKSYLALQTDIMSSFCNGYYHHHELVHLERKEFLAFEQEDPSIEKCRLNFKKEFNLLIHRTRKPYVNDMKTWINAL
jgi:hypothetical protein